MNTLILCKFIKLICTLLCLNTQGMALSLGDKINLSQKKATSVVDPTPGSKEGSSS